MPTASRTATCVRRGSPRSGCPRRSPSWRLRRRGDREGGLVGDGDRWPRSPRWSAWHNEDRGASPQGPPVALRRPLAVTWLRPAGASPWARPARRWAGVSPGRAGCYRSQVSVSRLRPRRLRRRAALALDGRFCGRDRGPVWGWSGGLGPRHRHRARGSRARRGSPQQGDTSVGQVVRPGRRTQVPRGVHPDPVEEGGACALIGARLIEPRPGSPARRRPPASSTRRSRRPSAARSTARPGSASRRQAKISCADRAQRRGASAPTSSRRLQRGRAGWRPA